MKHVADIERVRLPSGEEKLVPSPELEKVIAEQLERNGPAIREALSRCKAKLAKQWPLRMADKPDE